MSRRSLPALLTALLLAGPAAGTLSAQSGSGEGFLFGTPKGAFTLRAGFDQPRAGGPLFGRLAEDLTLDQGSYGALNLGADLSVRIAPRLELAIGAGWARSTARSEYRDFDEPIAGAPPDAPGRPITQETRFSRLPVTATVRAYLTPRGQTLSRYAWVPARFAPYVGVRGGAAYTTLRQQGDFIEERTLDIVTGTRETGAWTPTAHALAVAEFSLSPRLGITTEARYTVGQAKVRGPDFPGLDRLDLSGLQATVGLSIRY